jgi:hypothetical protein
MSSLASYMLAADWSEVVTVSGFAPQNPDLYTDRSVECEAVKDLR